jgi:isopentenyl-diphosphate Delta-isomerase
MVSGLDDKPTQKMICVEPNGKETGRVVDRRTAHTAPGVKHLAIQVLVFNSKGDLILQERSMGKVGGGVLDAPTTHVLAGETPSEAAVRCLKDEYGIMGRHKVVVLEGYSYDKDYGDGTCENEFLLAAYLVYDGVVRPNRKEVERIVRLPVREVLEELIISPENFAVWLKDTVRIVKNDNEASRLFV